MNRRRRFMNTLLLSTVLAAPLLTTACAEHHYYRAYDPYYNDYHRWDNHEVVYYNQWVVETRRPHRDFRKLSREDQRQYWEWRHRHGG